MTSLDIAGAVDRATRGVLANGGSTVSVVRKPDPVAGYVVANGENESTTDLDSTSVELDARQAIRAYVELHRAALAQTGAYLGAWVDDGYLVLDIVSVLPERNAALNLARANGERAIFHLDTRETLWTRDYFTRAALNAPARQLLDSNN
jgi:hypothetical protein